MIRIFLILSTAVLPLYGLPSLAAEPQSALSDEAMAMMQAMHATMKQIRKTKDPEERKQLMHEHMESLNMGMAMMERMEGGQHGDKGVDARAQQERRTECRQEDMQCQEIQAMKAEQHNLQERMKMMRMMMQQMMEHHMVRHEDPGPSS